MWHIDLPTIPRVVWRFETLPKGYLFSGEPEATHREDPLAYCVGCGLDLRVDRRIVVKATLEERLRLVMLRAACYVIDRATDFRERAAYIAPLKDMLACYSPREIRMHDAYVQGLDDEQCMWCGVDGDPEFVGVGADGALLFEVLRVTAS